MAVTFTPNLLPVKGHFFLFFSACSPVILFMTTFAKQLGFSAVLVGSIFTVIPLLSMTGKLIMGGLADRRKWHKSIILFFLITSVISCSLLTFIKPTSKKVDAELICNNNSSVRLCPPAEDTVEKCIESRIKAEFTKNTTIKCNMECTVDNHFIESVCETWNYSRYCRKPSKELRTTTMTVEEPDITYTDSDASKTSSPIPNITFSLLHFDAILWPHEVKKEGRCLSIEIGGIKDDALEQENLHVPYCKTPTEFNCRMVCESPVLTEKGKVLEEENVTSHSQFWLYMLITAIIYIGTSSITCLGETICFGLLGDRTNEFGKQRLWGSLGWGVMSLVGGALVDLMSGKKAQKDYRPIFYTSAVIFALDFIVASRIQDTKRVKAKSIIWDVGKLLKNVRVIIYIVWCVVMGMSNGIVGNFLFWHLEDLTNCDSMQRIKTLEGLYITLQGFCGELPFFFLNTWVLNKIGYINAMSLTLFTFGTLFIMFSILNDPIHFLPLAILNGITFSTMYATMNVYASIISPPGTEATMQGLVGSLYEGLGVSLGSFISGFLMHYYKGPKVFRLYGTIALIMCALHICIQFFLQKFSPVDERGTDSRKSVQYNSPENAVKILNDEKS